VDRVLVPIVSRVRDVRGAIPEDLDHAVFEKVPERGAVVRVVGDLAGTPRSEMQDPAAR
jgi:hypothetical protein